MDADGKAEQVSNQEQVPVRSQPEGMALAAGQAGFLAQGFLPPSERQPDGQRREEHRQGVDLGLDGVEPERVGDGEGAGADEAAGQSRQPLRGRGLLGRTLPFPHQAHDDQVGQQDRQGTGEHGNQVHRQGHVGRRDEHREETPDEHVEGGARRVRDFQLVRNGNEFARVPERGRRGDGEHVQDERVYENSGGDEPLRHFPVHRDLFPERGRRVSGAGLRPRCRQTRAMNATGPGLIRRA